MLSTSTRNRHDSRSQVGRIALASRTACTCMSSHLHLQVVLLTPASYLACTCMSHDSRSQVVSVALASRLTHTCKLSRLHSQVIRLAHASCTTYKKINTSCGPVQDEIVLKMGALAFFGQTSLRLQLWEEDHVADAFLTEKHRIICSPVASLSHGSQTAR
jgi:hypothetical protein